MCLANPPIFLCNEDECAHLMGCKKGFRQHMLEYMISLMDDANDFCGFRPKPATQCYCVRWNRERLNHILTLWLLTELENLYLVHTFIRAHVYRKKITQDKGGGGGGLYKHICASCFASAGKTFPHVEVDCKINTKVIQKRLKMGEHKWVLAHKCRLVVNSNVNVTTKMLATHDQWLTWFVVNKSMNTTVNHRSYAEVLQNGNPIVKLEVMAKIPLYIPLLCLLDFLLNVLQTDTQIAFL